MGAGMGAARWRENSLLDVRVASDENVPFGVSEPNHCGS